MAGKDDTVSCLVHSLNRRKLLALGDLSSQTHSFTGIHVVLTQGWGLAMLSATGGKLKLGF